MQDAATFIFAAVGLAVVIFLVVLVVQASARAKKERAEILAKQIEQAQSDIERMEAADGDISKLPDLTDQVEGLILSAGERCFALCKGAQHVVQAHRTICEQTLLRCRAVSFVRERSLSNAAVSINCLAVMGKCQATFSESFAASQIRPNKRNARSRRGQNPFSGKITAADRAFHGRGPTGLGPVAGKEQVCDRRLL